MGDLIVMPRSNLPSRPRNIPGGGATILFFTGVRYYRMNEEKTPVATPKRRRSVKANKASVSRRLEGLA